ncbi:hypothetical protein E4T42_09554, partial [Aureobasidium subglaciale]
IELTLPAVRIGEVRSIRAAERAYDIPESTLRARLNGTANRSTAHQHRKRLSVRQQNTRILRMNGDNEEFGNKFLLEGLSKPQGSMEHGTNPEAILEFYTLSEDIIGRSRIQPCNTWNMNGYGIAVGVCINTRVPASSKKRRSYVKSPGSRECVSIIEVVSPTG